MSANDGEVLRSGGVGLGRGQVLALMLRQPVAAPLEVDQLDATTVELVVAVEDLDVGAQV